MEKFYINFTSKSHKTDSFILHLSNKGFIGITLGSDKLSNEVLTIGFGNSLRLGVENIGKIIMILLACITDFNKWKYKDSRWEEDSGAEVNSTDILEYFSMCARDFLEEISNWIKTVVHIFFISITTYLNR